VKLNPFKNGGVKEEERPSFVNVIIRAYGFTLCAWTNRNVGITLSPKHSSLAVRLFVPVLPHVLAGGKNGGLDKEFNGSPRVECFVIYVGRRVGSGFCSSHFKEKAKKEKKRRRRKKRGFHGRQWRDSKKPRKTKTQKKKNRENPKCINLNSLRQLLSSEIKR